MAKGRKAKARAGSAMNGAAPVDEEAEIASTRAAIAPAVAQGISHFRLASACGAHPDDLKGFLEGRVSLTPALRARLRAAAPSILEGLDPMKKDR